MILAAVTVGYVLCGAFCIGAFLLHDDDDTLDPLAAILTLAFWPIGLACELGQMTRRAWSKRDGRQQ